ncbi:hypothetical protein SUGI_0521280 [Cryptomeria japonica]|nr:hypothetical protein SUGI_0521280 [Cryptomeria japonica]
MSRSLKKRCRSIWADQGSETTRRGNKTRADGYWKHRQQTAQLNRRNGRSGSTKYSARTVSNRDSNASQSNERNEV